MKRVLGPVSRLVQHHSVTACRQRINLRALVRAEKPEGVQRIFVSVGDARCTRVERFCFDSTRNRPGVSTERTLVCKDVQLSLVPQTGLAQVGVLVGLGTGVPNREGKAATNGPVGHVVVPAQQRRTVGTDADAEFAEQNGQPVLRGPVLHQVKVAVHRGFVLRRSPRPDFVMRELPRQVVVEVRHQVRVVRRVEVQRRPVRVFSAPGKQHNPVRVRLPDDPQDSRVQRVDLRFAQVEVRLVDDFEEEFIRLVFEALGHLAPQALEAGQISGKVVVEPVVVVRVDDGDQPARQSPVHHLFYAVQPGSVDCVWRLGAKVSVPGYRDAHAGETGVAVVVEVELPGWRSPPAFLRGVQRVAQIDAPAHSFDHHPRVHLGRSQRPS